jgi:hypothetical protein
LQHGAVFQHVIHNHPQLRNYQVKTGATHN